MILTTRKKDLCPPCLLPHLFYVAANAVALLDYLTGNHLLTANNTLGTPQINRNHVRLSPFDNAGYHLTNTVFVFFVLTGTFGFPHFLINHLLSSRGRNPPRLQRRQSFANLIPHPKLGIAMLGISNTDLGCLVLHHINHGGDSFQSHIASLTIDGRTNIAVLPIVRPPRLLNRLFHSIQHQITADAFVAGDNIGYLN